MATISSLVPGMKNISLSFVIIERSSTPLHTAAGPIYYLWVADLSASIVFILHSPLGAKMNAGDMMAVTDGVVGMHKGRVQLSLERNVGKIERCFILMKDMAVIWQCGEQRPI